MCRDAQAANPEGLAMRRELTNVTRHHSHLVFDRGLTWWWIWANIGQLALIVMLLVA